MSLFRRGPSKAEVEAALENVRGLVEILKLTADLSPAESLLREAEALLAKNDTVHAKSMVETAERVATAIETDSRAAADAGDILRGVLDRMKALNVPVEEEETALAGIGERTGGSRAAEVPDYAGARALAEDAAKRGEAKLALAEQATDAVFAAELAVEGARESFPDGRVDALEEAVTLLEKARQEFSLGRSELAATDARVAEEIALGVVDQRRKALEMLASVEKLVAGLRGLGIPMTPVSKSLEMGRTLLGKGKVVAAVEVFDEASQEAVQLGQQYRQLLDTISAAAKAVDALRAEGLRATEAESALLRAKTAMKAGNYALAAALADDVHLAARRQRETRESLRKWLEESKAQVANLRNLGLAFVNDADEMVAKAEQEFANGDYVATNEDLRIASLLMKPALNGKLGRGPEVVR